MKRRLGYLSGAPRVSTHPQAEAGGPRSHVLGVIGAFEALNWEVKSFIVGDRMPQRLVSQGSEKALTKGFLLTLTADFIRLILGIFNAIRAWQELGQQVDWVYERFAVLQSIGSLFKRHNIPWILETNGLFYKEAKSERKSMVLSGLARYLETKCYRDCDVLICVSHALKDIAIREAGVEAEKILVVSNGVDTEFFHPDKYVPKRLFTGFTLGFVGNLAKWQGINLLLEVLNEIRLEKGIEINLAIVGDGLMFDEWKALANNLKLSSQVCFLGQVARNEIPALIAGFDVGYSGHLNLKGDRVYHSPLKLYEYMAMCKPVVASAVEDVRAVVGEGETGFLFQPGDREDLKQALMRAYEARKHLSLMGCKARQKVVTDHSWVARCQTTIEQIEQILQMKGKS